MSCCGGSTSSPTGGGPIVPNAPMPSAMAAPAFGAGGMTLLAYSGKEQETFAGTVSGATYRFGGKRKAGYVDSRDVEGLIALGVFSDAGQ